MRISHRRQFVIPTTPEVKGQTGEESIADIIDSSTVGKLLCNLYVPTRSDVVKEAEIDLVFICEKGIFVFESKNYGKCGVYGNDNMEQWKIYYKDRNPFKRERQVYSPVLQNEKHIEYLQRLLKVDMVKFHNIIIFGNMANIEKTFSSKATIIPEYKLRETLRDIYKELPDVFTKEQIVEHYNTLKYYIMRDEAQRNRHAEEVRNFKGEVGSGTYENTAYRPVGRTNRNTAPTYDMEGYKAVIKVLKEEYSTQARKLEERAESECEAIRQETERYTAACKKDMAKDLEKVPNLDVYRQYMAYQDKIDSTYKEKEAEIKRINEEHNKEIQKIKDKWQGKRDDINHKLQELSGKSSKNSTECQNKCAEIRKEAYTKVAEIENHYKPLIAETKLSSPEWRKLTDEKEKETRKILQKCDADKHELCKKTDDENDIIKGEMKKLEDERRETYNHEQEEIQECNKEVKPVIENADKHYNNIADDLIKKADALKEPATMVIDRQDVIKSNYNREIELFTAEQNKKERQTIEDFFEKSKSLYSEYSQKQKQAEMDYRIPERAFIFNGYYEEMTIHKYRSKFDETYRRDGRRMFERWSGR